MFRIKGIGCRKVLNSHVEFTNEFIVEMEDGRVGIGASPRGETVSIYEDKKNTEEAEKIIHTIERDGYLGKPLEQKGFDEYLAERIFSFGKNNAYGLSLAFFNATRKSRSLLELFGKPEGELQPPYICCNILNGGWHAYTNPVLSDFPEFILVSKSNNLEEVVENHNRVQRTVKSKLNKQAKIVVGGNRVNRFATVDNRECIDFLLNICESLGLKDKFDLMIDASGGDLWTGEGYRFAITDRSIWASEDFCEYWMGIIKQYDLRFIEDPFSEQDLEIWQRLTTTQQICKVVGDNLYSSDSDRIQEGSRKQYTHGVVIKPNQSGTVSGVRRAIEASQRYNQIIITSHRSISTESTFLSTLTCMYGLKYIKIGPLMTDFSSVIRLNEIIRLTRNINASRNEDSHN